MKKIIFFTLSLLITSTLNADASIAQHERNKTYLLSAPGTLTGMGESKQESAAPKTVAPSSFIQPRKYQYIPDHYKFPQYGQTRGQANPWAQRPQRQQRMLPPPDRQQSFHNPWDISNLPSIGPDSYRNKPMPGGSMMPPLYGGDLGSSDFYPDFRTTLDHGGRPSAAGFPYMNGLMPGLGKDDSGFPFMPFDMF